MCHSLSDVSTCVATVLSSWMAVPGLMPESEILQVFHAKASRTGKSNGKGVEGPEEVHIKALNRYLPVIPTTQPMGIY